MNRKNDVVLLFDDITEKLSMTRQDYEKALRDDSHDFRVRVKNLMENLRSALDYMAHGIYESFYQSVRIDGEELYLKKIYFPYGKTEADFKSSIGNSLPDLATLAPDIYKILLSVQPFVCGDSWLCDLCSILNDNKHNRLTAQERTESETYTVESKYGSITIPINNPNFKVTSMTGVEIFGVPAEFREDGIHTAPSYTLKHKRIKWVAFTFEGTNVNVINLLDKATVGIKNLAEELYQKI